MAVVLSKEEILERLSSTKTTATTTQTSLSSFGDTLLNFLNSPVGQELVKRLLDRWLPAKENPVVQVSQPTQNNPISPEKLYTIILGILTSASQGKPDMTVSQLKEEFEKNKEEILKVIENVVKSI